MYINLGLIGNPLNHTLSPLIHTHFLYETNLNGGYTCFDIENNCLDNIVEMFRKYLFVGVNVTVPFKCDIMRFCDNIDDTVKSMGAVNTLHFSNGIISGYNTDIYGFSKIFEENNINVSDKTVLLLGAGGASRAALKFFKDNKPKKLYFANRTIEKALELKDFFNIDTSVIDMQSVDDIECDIVVNSTSLGIKNEAFPYKAKVREYAIDMQYKPYITSFLSLYNNEKEIVKINGISMLIWQAYKSFNIWTGKTFNPNIEKLKYIMYNN